MSKYSDFYNPLSPWHALSRPHLFAYKNLYELNFFHILNMRIKKTQNPSIFLATHWTLSLKSGDLGQFFHEKKALYRFKSYFSGRSLAKFRQKKTKKEKALAQAGARR
jgi:hypothetical protein